MKSLGLAFLLASLHSNTLASEWIFLGPDSVGWRSVVQMDVSFREGRLPYVAVATAEGICWEPDGSWRYVCRDQYGVYPLPEAVMFRAVYFSPWDDSIAFIGFNVQIYGEPGSQGGRVSDIFRPNWGMPSEIGGGSVGFSPSLSYEFSPHRQGRVYSWIINYNTSSDRGLTWERFDEYNAISLSVDGVQDSMLYAGRPVPPPVGPYALYRSTDDGSTWEHVREISITSPYPSQRTAELAARGDTLILAVNRFPQSADTSCGISVSTDRGTTWTDALTGVNVQKITRDEGFPNEWYAATDRGVYRSEDRGISWRLLLDSLPSLNLVDIRKDPFSDTLYIATSDLGVYKISGLTVGVSDGPRLPEGFQLHQNYPNPFNPSTTIHYGLPARSHVTLSVFNTLGQQVATLVQGEQEAGYFEVQFDASGLSSGVYLCRLQAGDFVESMKLVLVR